MIKQRLAKLLDKEMDRRSFLIHAAAGAVAVVGASTVAKTLSSNSGSSLKKKIGQSQSSQAFGYGGAPYGR